MLGCQSDGSANGAIKWVNANNVNVAFTRAKEYVYVIGDATKWAELNKKSCIRSKVFTCLYFRGYLKNIL